MFDLLFPTELEYADDMSALWLYLFYLMGVLIWAAKKVAERNRRRSDKG